jgi:hypothetical protein
MRQGKRERYKERERERERKRRVEREAHPGPSFARASFASSTVLA